MDRFAVFAFRWMAARSCSLMRMSSFLFFISYSVSKSGCRASARRAAAAGVGFAGDQPSAMLALSPKGEYKGVTLRYSVCYYGRKEKRGVHAVCSAVFRLCAARSGVCSIFRLLGVQGIFCGRFGRRESLLSYFFFCCNIYSVGLVLWV